MTKKFIKNLDNNDLVSLNNLKDISDRNAELAEKFLVHESEIVDEKFRKISVDSNLDISELENVIIDNKRSLKISRPFELENLIPEEKTYESDDLYVDSKKDALKKFIRVLENEKIKKLESEFDSLQKENDGIRERIGRNKNFVKHIKDGNLRRHLKSSNISNVLLMSDTFFTRESKMYKNVVGVLDECNIPYVEFTNIQPNLDRKLVFTMAEFANDHSVNAFIVVGCMSTVHLAKILISKVMKPNLIRLQKSAGIDPIIASKYYIFTIPTVVVPEPKVNARSLLKNSILFPKLDFFCDTILLDNAIDDSTAIFYTEELFNLLSREKLIEVLHETFFRLIMNYFDYSMSDSACDKLVGDIKKILDYLSTLKKRLNLDAESKEEMLRIIASTVDGSSVVDVFDYWLWFRLEGSLSLLVNSKKSDGLALFLPTFLEVFASQSLDFNKRAAELGSKLYGSYSVDGFIVHLIRHIKEYNLPVCFLDIPEIKKINYMFIVSLIKKSSCGVLFGKLARNIIKNLNTW